MKLCNIVAVFLIIMCRASVGIPKIDGIPFGIPNGTWYLGFPFRGLYLRYEDGIIGMDVYLPILCMDC